MDKQYQYTKFLNTSVKTIDKPKNQYSTHNLLDLCNKFILKKYGNFYKIYTDGSKDGQEAGAAFLDIQTKDYVKFKIGNPKISIMYTELIAIAEALSYIKSIVYNNKKFVICTDSKSALQHLDQRTSTARGIPIAYDIINTILELSSKNKIIILQWIPSQVGIYGNDAVDKLAKEACSDGVSFDCEPYYTNLLPVIKEHCIKLWSEYFDKRSLTKGIWYKTIQPSILRLPWFDRCTMGKYDIVTGLKLRSGHIPLNKFAFMMGKVTTPNCSDCGVLEDVHHILVECVRNERLRVSLDVNLLDVGWCNSILALPTSSEAKLLYKIAKMGIRNGTFPSN